MAAARFYSSVSGAIDLTASIGSGDTSIAVSSTTGLPGTTPFALVLDPGLATEEIIDVTNVSGLTLTVTRGVDGSSAQAHSAGVGNVRHMATARDFREPQEHIGATADVHGVGAGSDVVGTDTVQVLTNKTAEAASAATVGLVVKGAATQTASYLEVQDSAGSAVASVKPGEGTVTVGTALVNNSAAATLFGYVAKIAANAAAVVPAIIKAAASQTADLLQIQNSAGTTLAKFDKDGKLTAPQVTSTGPVSGTTGAFSGAITSPTITTLTDADTALDGRLDTLEANGVTVTGGLTMRVANITPGTTDASGFATIAHGCSFTPSKVIGLSAAPGASFAVLWGADTFTSTNVRLRFMDARGTGAYASTAVGAAITLLFIA